ncbi:MAG: hypothetical protein AAGM36_19940 [Cyanobacteria bacterium J06597_1]
MSFKYLGALVAGASLALTPIVAHSQGNECLFQLQEYDQPSGWMNVRSYFASLIPASSPGPDANDLVFLTQLRMELVNLQLQKRQLIVILETHRDRGVGATVLRSNLAVRDIPQIVQRTGAIIQDLKELAEIGNLFAAEEVFSELYSTLNIRKAVTVCELAGQLETPNFDDVTTDRIINQLKTELELIKGAEDALAEFIRERGQ